MDKIVSSLDPSVLLLGTLPAVSTPSTSHTCLSVSIQDKPSGYAYLTKDSRGNIPGCLFLFLEWPLLFQSGSPLCLQTVL